jgi:hypothetical protein
MLGEGCVALKNGGHIGRARNWSRLCVLLSLTGAACLEARCSSEPPVPPDHYADCGAFETSVKTIPGLPEWVPRNSNGHLLELGVDWCVEASPTLSPGDRDWADRLLQARLFGASQKQAAPLKHEHVAAIDAFTASAEKLLCPDWRTTPYQGPNWPNKHVVHIQCR